MQTQHAHGRQTISRAELAAITWTIQESSRANIRAQITITTDSQYAIDTITRVTDSPHIPLRQSMAHVGLCLFSFEITGFPISLSREK